MVGQGNNHQRHMTWRIHTCQEFCGKGYSSQVEQSDGAEFKYTIKLSFGGKVGGHVGATKRGWGGDGDHVNNLARYMDSESRIDAGETDNEMAL